LARAKRAFDDIAQRGLGSVAEARHDIVIDPDRLLGVADLTKNETEAEASDRRKALTCPGRAPQRDRALVSFLHVLRAA